MLSNAFTRSRSPIAGLLVLFALLTPPTSPAADAARRQPGRILLQTSPDTDAPALQQLLAEHQARLIRNIDRLGIHMLEVPDPRVDAVLAALARHPRVEFAEADALIEPAVTPNDTYVSSQWHLPVISAPLAWDSSRGDASIVIAILDSGIDASHPDLSGKIVPGWNFAQNNSNTSDADGHGTAVAAVASAATDNGQGVAGIGWHSRLMPIRVTDLNGYGILSAMAEGLVYAADHGARVANISFAASSSSTVRSAAEYFRNKGGVVTVAAGNNAAFDGSPDNPFVLTISATTATDQLAPFSNYGNNIDLAAPGENLLTTVAGGGYGYGTGTSFSAPVVAGVAALALAANPALTGLSLQNILLESADDRGLPGWDTNFGWGRINAAAAVAAALENSPDTAPPTTSISAPTSGSTVAGSVIVSVAASDNVAVTRVELFVDSVLVASTAALPAQFAWNTTDHADGGHQLVAKAYDGSGNGGASAPVFVTVQNSVPADTIDSTAPESAITSPAPGTKVSRKQKVIVQAADNVGVVRIDLLVDGRIYASATASPATFYWNTTSVSRGTHTLQASAFDVAGNRGLSAPVSVTK